MFIKELWRCGGLLSLRPFPLPVVAPAFGTLLAKLIVTGASRAKALRRLATAVLR